MADSAVDRERHSSAERVISDRLTDKHFWMLLGIQGRIAQHPCAEASVMAVTAQVSLLAVKVGYLLFFTGSCVLDLTCNLESVLCRRLKEGRMAYGRVGAALTM